MPCSRRWAVKRTSSRQHILLQILGTAALAFKTFYIGEGENMFYTVSIPLPPYDAFTVSLAQLFALCNSVSGSVSPYVTLNFDNNSDSNAQDHDFRVFTNDPRPDWYFEIVRASSVTR